MNKSVILSVIVTITVGGIILGSLGSALLDAEEQIADDLSKAYIVELELRGKYYYTLQSYHSNPYIEEPELCEVELLSKIIRDQEKHESVLANDYLRGCHSAIFTMGSLYCNGKWYKFPTVENEKYSFEELILNEKESIDFYKNIDKSYMQGALLKDLDDIIQNKCDHILEIQKLTGLEIVSSEERFEDRYTR